MIKLFFEGIGTHWNIHYYPPKAHANDAGFSDQLRTDILKLVSTFDHTYSRFKSDSLVSQLASSHKTTHTIPKEFAHLLAFGLKLKQVTHDHFNPAIGQMFENIGYNASYSFTPTARQHPLHLEWSLEGQELTTPKPVLFDIGGWGKGYLIDQIAIFLESKNIKHYLVDGGGDIYATQKPDHSPWVVALEHPHDPNQAIGKVHIHHQAIASSGSTKRRFNNFHHLIDATSQNPVQEILGIHTIADSAMVADGVATALFVSPANLHSSIATAFNIESLILYPDFTFQTSQHFSADIFLKSDN